MQSNGRLFYEICSNDDGNGVLRLKFAKMGKCIFRVLEIREKRRVSASRFIDF